MGTDFLDANDDEIENGLELKQEQTSFGKNQHAPQRHISARQCIILLSRIILPSFIINRLYGRSRTKSTTPPRPTAYFDGLRGAAALIVYIFHYSYLWFPVLPYGYGSLDTHYYFWQLPIIRVIHSGRASVTVFFLISGYVLSVKTISIIKTRGSKLDGEKVLDTISGSVFRRPFRLFPSIVVQTGIIAVLARWPNLHQPIVDNNPVTIPPTLPSASEQFWHWLSTLSGTFQPFQVVPGRSAQIPNLYDGHLWTIPVEFSGSMMIFLCLTALCRSKPWIRTSVLLFIIAWAFKLGFADQGVFLAGPLLAEAFLTWPPYHTYSTSDQDGAIEGAEIVGRKQGNNYRIGHLLGHCTTILWFLLGCHLCSWPGDMGAQSPGYRTLAEKYTPAPYHGNESMTQLYWISWGGVLIMLALMYSPPLRPSSVDEPLLQRLFTNRFAAYLGEISYSMYLCHSSVNEIVGMRYLRPAWFAWMDANQEAVSLLQQNEADAATALMDAANSRYMKRSVLGMFVNTFVLFWVSDLFNRAVDARTVRFTKKVSEWAKKKH
ncbi:acyltransferase family-domain-containing protein [Diaporthe sp. PMI_573]|nr:acyltransferase family-domain-containing protein [Diaporthaceae sp. PMI_573]